MFFLFARYSSFIFFVVLIFSNVSHSKNFDYIRDHFHNSLSSTKSLLKNEVQRYIALCRVENQKSFDSYGQKIVDIQTWQNLLEEEYIFCYDLILILENKNYSKISKYDFNKNNRIDDNEYVICTVLLIDGIDHLCSCATYIYLRNSIFRFIDQVSSTHKQEKLDNLLKLLSSQKNEIVIKLSSLLNEFYLKKDHSN